MDMSTMSMLNSKGRRAYSLSIFDQMVTYMEGKQEAPKRRQDGEM